MNFERLKECKRQEVKSEVFTAINNCCVLELMPQEPIDSNTVLNYHSEYDDRNSNQIEGRKAQAGANIRVGRGETGIQESLPSEKQGQAERCGDGELLCKPGREPALSQGVVSQARQEDDRQNKGLGEGQSRTSEGAEPAVLQETRRPKRGKNKGVVSEESGILTPGSVETSDKESLQHEAGNIRQSGGGAKGVVRDLQNPTSKESEAIGGSLPFDGGNPGASLHPLQHGHRPLSGQDTPAKGGDKVSVKRGHADNSVDLILTSIPFSVQYEYSSSILDMGHNESNAKFFEQMDFLIPNLLRVLRPGRIAAIHTKDRILFSSVTGDGMPTVYPFSDETVAAFRKHGFRYIGRITIDTDVVRENAQTYRLGWSENAKDSSKMGCGMPEYVLLFRKLPTDTSDAYADVPVTKDKQVYGRSDWQLDAAGFWRSCGNRLPDPDFLAHLDMKAIGSWWRDYCVKGGYNYKEHVELAKVMETKGRLPASFMLFPPISRHKDIWTDIARMRTLNSEQERHQQRKHLCPLQIDVVERLITRYTNDGEIILDPFAGIFTVPYMAIKMNRIGIGIELSEEYWRNGVGYCEMAEQKATAPTLFDMSQFGINTKDDATGGMADGEPVED